jgi:very-short-patch-repair endonuclease
VGHREVERSDRDLPSDERRSHRRRAPAAALLAPDEVTTRDGIPVTTAARALLDLAAVLAPARLARALHEAEHHRLADPVGLAALLDRHPGRRGLAALRALLAEEALGTQQTRSPLEDDFLAFAREHRLPRPETNVRREGLEVDVVYRGARLVVELDGRAAHATAAAFERDRARDRALAAAGWRVMRLTSRQLRDEPGAVAADLRSIAGTQTG